MKNLKTILTIFLIIFLISCESKSSKILKKEKEKIAQIKGLAHEVDYHLMYIQVKNWLDESFEKAQKALNGASTRVPYNLKVSENKISLTNKKIGRPYTLSRRAGEKISFHYQLQSGNQIVKIETREELKEALQIFFKKKQRRETLLLNKEKNSALITKCGNTVTPTGNIVKTEIAGNYKYVQVGGKSIEIVPESKIIFYENGSILYSIYYNE